MTITSPQEAALPLSFQYNSYLSTFAAFIFTIALASVSSPSKKKRRIIPNLRQKVPIPPAKLHPHIDMLLDLLPH